MGGAAFSIDGVKYELPKNVGDDALHGGIVGFDKVTDQAIEYYRILRKRYKKSAVSFIL